MIEKKSNLNNDTARQNAPLQQVDRERWERENAEFIAAIENATPEQIEQIANILKVSGYL